MLAQRLDDPVELGFGKNFADDARLARALRIDNRGGPDQIGHRLARHAIDQRRHDHGRHDVVCHLGNLELGGIGRQCDVADRGNGAAETESAAAHHPDYGNLAAAERPIAVEYHVVAAAQLECLGRGAGRAVTHGLAADAEILSRTAQNYDLRCIAGTEQELGQLDCHGVRGSVSGLWPIERDFQHRSLVGSENFAGHAWSSQTLFRQRASAR